MARYTIRIPRYASGEGGEPTVQDFTVEAQESWTVLDALNEIKWHQDGSLAYRRSCRHGICGSCAMTVNGVNRLTCETQLASLPELIVVEPLRGLPVIKDLVVDMGSLYEAMMLVQPYLVTRTTPPSDRERLQSPVNRAKLDGFYECILCASCTSSCPSFWADKEYLGPHACLWAWRFVADSRDDGAGDRLSVLDDKHGVWRCHTIYNCVEVCPKSLNPTSAISKLKRAIIKGKF